jgi:dTDP-4-dehydrorhamnose 3,5-epimerase
MKITKTKFKDLIIIEQENFVDYRGELRITFHQKNLNVNKFLFEYAVTSKKNVVRGLHFQKKFQQAKLVYVLKGKILDVVIDLRKKSKTFGKYFSIILSDKNKKALYIPEGFAHGYYCYENNNIIYYKLSNYYKPEYEDGIMWNANDVKIKWPNGKKILSTKDLKLKNLKQFKEKHIRKINLQDEQKKAANF